MTFRTPEEAIELANNTRYGLAASVWTENVNLALDLAAKVKAGTVWINSTNLFDAASGFGGYRESGFGREGGKEGLWEYVKPRWQAEAKKARRKKPLLLAEEDWDEPAASGLPPIDRTAKLYIGGKQTRPDGEASRKILGPDGKLIGEVGEGNRKDVRNAVEAARKAAPGWAKSTAHLRAQILYYTAENLAARRDELARRLDAMTGAGTGRAEVDLAVERLFTYAAWADKYAGTVQATPLRNFTFAYHEPIGTLAVVCPDEQPLLAFVATVAPAIAMGNTVVAVPSERWPLAATDLYQVFDTSDVPGGCDQHRHRQPRHPVRCPRRPRRRGRPLVLRHPRRQRRRRARLHRQSQAHLGRLRASPRLGRSRAGSGRGVPAAGDSGEEHLGAVWGVGDYNRPQSSTTASAARRPDTMAPCSEGVSRWSPQR